MEVKHFKDFFEVAHPTSRQISTAPVDEREESYDQLRIEVEHNRDWLRLVGAHERLEEVCQEGGEGSNDGLVSAQSHTPAFGPGEMTSNEHVAFSELLGISKTSKPAGEDDIRGSGTLIGQTVLHL